MIERNSKGQFLKGGNLGNQNAKGNKPNKTSFKKGGHLSVDTEFKKGIANERYTGKNHPNYKNGKYTRKYCIDCGIRLKKKTAKRCRKCHSKFIGGKNHWNWLGGKSFEEYGKEFKPLRKQILKRDNYQCQECSFFQKNLKYSLCIHHIDYNKKNNNPDNLIALCRSCHLQTNYKREDWTNYFREKLLCQN